MKIYGDQLTPASIYADATVNTGRGKEQRVQREKERERLSGRIRESKCERAKQIEIEFMLLFFFCCFCCCCFSCCLVSAAEFLLFDELLCEINLCLVQGKGGGKRNSCNGENEVYLQLMRTQVDSAGGEY